jgi:bifunctional DNase/RNase
MKLRKNILLLSGNKNPSLNKHLMEKIRLEIVGMSYSQSQSGAYALILGEVKGKRRLPIIIGGFEAQAIAVELEKMKPTRPLTHDLFKSFADTYLIQVKEVVIDQFKQGVFHAKLICVQHNVENSIDSRTSDAVALAIRFKCPIYTFENIMMEAGMQIDENASPADDIASATDISREQHFEQYTLSELEEMLQKAVEQEEYEKASKLRDEIMKRQEE